MSSISTITAVMPTGVTSKTLGNSALTNATTNVLNLNVIEEVQSTTEYKDFKSPPVIEDNVDLMSVTKANAIFKTPVGFVSEEGANIGAKLDVFI